MDFSLDPNFYNSFTTFGDLLKYLRRRERLTQLELSIAVGYSEAQISRLEKNQRLPDLTTIKALFVPALHLERLPQLMTRFLELAQTSRQEDAPTPGIPPYKGLLFFDESDAELFFGREALTAQLTRHVMDLAMDAATRFLAVVGASGSGKSSLVRAGLSVALQRAGWDTCVFTPTAHPVEMLEANLNPARMKNAERDLILVDQFEEVFTLCRDEMERIAFIEKLLSNAQDKSKNTTVVIALRADFYSHCAQYPLLRQAVAAQQEYIGQMTAEELRRAIEEPARRGGWEFESGLVDLLLNDIGAQGTSEPEPGALPLLSHALLATWERRSGRRFTLNGYHASGGVQGAIAETAESVFNDQLNQTQQELARDVFLRLTELGEGTEDTRRRATLTELVRQSAETTQLRAVLNTLAEARLITLNEDSTEVAHEALIREWQRLHEWLTQDRQGLLLHRHLTESTHEWERRGRDPSELYRGARLAQAREWAAANTERLNVTEQAYLAASIEREEQDAIEREAQRQRELEAAQALAETQRRAAKQLRRRAIYLATALALAVLTALTAGIFANRNSTLAAQNAASASYASSQQAVAEEERARAEAEADGRATQQALAEDEAQARTTAEAIAFHERDLAQAQLLAAEANSLMLSNGLPDLIALLGVRSLNMLYTPAGDALLTNTSLADISPRKLMGHTNGIAVGGAVFSPDGKYLATAEYKTARLWDLVTGETIRVFSGHTDELPGIAFSTDGKTLATTSLDGTAKLWDVDTGQVVRTLTGPTGVIFFGIDFSPDGKTILTGSDLSEDSTARLWEAATGQMIREFVGHTAGVGSVDISPDGRLIGTASRDGTARLWEAATGIQLHLLQGHENEIAVIRFSPDGNLVATSGDDRIIRLWDTTSGQLEREFEGHKDWVQTLAFAPNGKYLLSGSNDRTARLWDIASGQPAHVFVHPKPVDAVAFSPDGKTIATGSSDNLIRLWSLQATVGGTQLVGHTGVVWGASFSPDGKNIVTASADETARLWDAASGLELRKFTGHTEVVRDAIFSPGGKSVLTTSVDQTARLWDVATGKQIRLFAGHQDDVNRAAFSPDGKYVVTTSYDGTARVWDAQTAETLVIYTKQGPGHVNRVAFSPDGKTVVTSADDGTARIWDPLTGEEIMVLEGHTALVAGVAFSPDGTVLVTASWDGTVRLWEVASGRELRRFAGHSGYAFGAAFSPDGNYVLSSGADGTARLWEVQTGREVRRFAGHTNEVRSVVFSPDGKFILTASEDNTARVWLTDLSDTIRAVCAMLTRDLTPEERIQFGITDQEPTCPAQ